MVKIDSNWTKEYIAQVKELEEKLGHEICGCPTADGSPCIRWPSSALGRCLKHSDPNELSKILTGGKSEDLPEKKQEEKKETPRPQEKAESSSDSVETKPKKKEDKQEASAPDPSEKRIGRQKKQILFWMSLNIILLLIVAFLLIKVFYPELASVIQQEDAKIYAMAEKMYEEKEVLKALEQYKIIIEKYADGKYYDLALKRKQECLDYLKEANLKTIIQLKPKNEDALNAMIQLGNLYMERRQIRDAIEIFEGIINEYSVHDEIPYVLYRLSICYQNISDYNIENFQKAIDLLQKLIDDYPENPLVPESMYAIGFIYHDKLNDNKNALPYYDELITKYPDSKWAQEAQAIKSVLSEP